MKKKEAELLDNLKYWYYFLEEKEEFSSKADYFKALYRFVRLEIKYRKQFKAANKEIIKHLLKCPLDRSEITLIDWFPYMYNPLNPVRLAVETFDIEEIKQESLKNIFKK